MRRQFGERLASRSSGMRSVGEGKFRAARAQHGDELLLIAFLQAHRDAGMDCAKRASSAGMKRTASVRKQPTTISPLECAGPSSAALCPKSDDVLEQKPRLVDDAFSPPA